MGAPRRQDPQQLACLLWLLFSILSLEVCSRCKKSLTEFDLYKTGTTA